MNHLYFMGLRFTEQTLQALGCHMPTKKARRKNLIIWNAKKGEWKAPGRFVKEVNAANHRWVTGPAEREKTQAVARGLI